ncbi:MAG TPA: aminotransferase class V-fold PLP-dependent enzyme [Vicinamibacterales bacterium]|nr:aminotransferase class V-fold PLP-dependent enzyme [Vicinamibacterales bacterium]
MVSRRSFLRITSAAGTAAVASTAYGLDHVLAASAQVAGRSATDVAQDEFYWREIQQAFDLDRTIINLNNGNSCPSPRVVHDALKRYLDFSNQAPVYYRGQLEQNREQARRRLAAEFGCDPEELAITRNSSESLQIAQNGLDLEPGDEVLTTEQDYGRMLTTWDQRARRDGIKVVKINFPVPTTADDLYQRFEKAITPNTKVLHFSHITNLTGQHFPVKRLSQLARQRGIVTIVDGAHAFAHFPFKRDDLECDYYGTSLHKWLLAPHNTGFLYVRRDRIAPTWPLTAAPARATNDIRKFEEVGTISAAPFAAINEALAFHQALGVERRAARMHYLTMRWANRLKVNQRVKFFSSMKPGETFGLALVGIEDIKAAEVSKFLWDKYRIIANAIVREDYQGIRVTPNIYTTLEEIDAFAAAMEDLLRSGVPKTTA